MKRLSPTQIIIGAIFFIIGACIAGGILIRYQFTSSNFSEATPEEIFRRHVVYGASIPAEVKQIQGIEGAVWGYTGPAFIRFKATDEFVSKIIAKGYAEPYVKVSCGYFLSSSSKYLVDDYPAKFEWWHPEQIISPVCYQAQGGQHDDTKYLLIESEGETIYFYRTPTCGLCSD